MLVGIDAGEVAGLLQRFAKLLEAWVHALIVYGGGLLQLPGLEQPEHLVRGFVVSAQYLFDPHQGLRLRAIQTQPYQLIQRAIYPSLHNARFLGDLGQPSVLA